MNRTRPYYYETTLLSDEALAAAMLTARRQEDAVMAVSRAAPAGLAPSQSGRASAGR